MTAPQVVRITSDQDAEGFEIGVEPHEDGGWMATEPGFHGILPGPGQRMYINGEEGWVRRRWGKLFILPEGSPPGR